MDVLVYAKAPNYGAPGRVGRKLDGAPLEGRHGGYGCCPRCWSPLGLALEQLEHLGDPCSVGHTGHRLDRALDPVGGPPVRCGAHFVTADPEQPATLDDIPHEAARAAFAREFGSLQLFKRPIVWHGDV